MKAYIVIITSRRYQADEGSRPGASNSRDIGHGMEASNLKLKLTAAIEARRI